MKKLLSIVLLTLAFAFPAFAQEATEAPAPDVTVIVESPDEAPVNETSQANLLFNVVLLVSVTAGVLYAMFLLHKSTPVEREAAQKRFDVALDKAVDQADKLADETKETDLDNMAVDLLKQLIALSRAGKLESILALLPNVPATPTEALYNPAETDRGGL